MKSRWITVLTLGLWLSLGALAGPPSGQGWYTSKALGLSVFVPAGSVASETNQSLIVTHPSGARLIFEVARSASDARQVLASARQRLLEQHPGYQPADDLLSTPQRCIQVGTFPEQSKTVAVTLVVAPFPGGFRISRFEAEQSTCSSPALTEWRQTLEERVTPVP